MKFKDLKGKIIKRITKRESIYGEDQILFLLDNDKEYIMHHEQDCCEEVYIESIVGDLNDLIDSEILIAEEVTNSENNRKSEYDESFTWTFYKLATIKGYVDIRWYGTSNGCYSESVEFNDITDLSRI